MARTLILCGYGTGISASVARHFGQRGFRVALVARSQDRLDAGVVALREAGVEAEGFACDLTNADALIKLIADVRGALGPISVLHWNAYYRGAGDLTTCSADELRLALDVGVTGLVMAVQQALPDLQAEAGAVLMTGSGFAKDSDVMNENIVSWNYMSLGVVKAAQHKLTALLHHKLASLGVYVGELSVNGVVKNTAFSADEGLDPDDVAAAMWGMFEAREAITTDFPGS